MSAGAAPLFFSERAMEKLANRKTKVASYYFDMTMVGDYWGWCALWIMGLCSHVQEVRAKHSSCLHTYGSVDQ